MEDEVHRVQRLGGAGDARRQALVLHRARRLGAHDLMAAHAQQRQNGHGQHQDAHAADPDQRGAPQVDGRRQRVQVGEHGGAGGGQAGHGLEIGAGEGQRHAGAMEIQHQRDRRQQRQAGPHGRHQHEAIARPQLAAVAPRQHRQPTADADRQQETVQEGVARRVLADVGHHQRDQHGEGEHHHGQAQYVEGGQYALHVRARRKRRKPGTTFPRAASACATARTR